MIAGKIIIIHILANKLACRVELLIIEVLLFLRMYLMQKDEILN